tara:strand:+ start:76 stop:345 length:270 start_codon:yes stop_codon:yes gene_type:complete
MKTIFKSFKEFLETPPEEMMYSEDVNEQIPSKADHKKMRDFTYHHVQNTQKDHPTIKRMFIKKFGSHNVKHFDKHVSALVDQYDPEAKK